MRRPAGRRHLDGDVLERGCLAGGPVDGRNLEGRRGSADVDDEVLDLAPEDIGGQPTFTIALVLYFDILVILICTLTAKEKIVSAYLITIDEENRVER